MVPKTCQLKSGKLGLGLEHWAINAIPGPRHSTNSKPYLQEEPLSKPWKGTGADLGLDHPTPCQALPFSAPYAIDGVRWLGVVAISSAGKLWKQSRKCSGNKGKLCTNEQSKWRNKRAQTKGIMLFQGARRWMWRRKQREDSRASRMPELKQSRRKGALGKQSISIGVKFPIETWEIKQTALWELI